MIKHNQKYYILINDNILINNLTKEIIDNFQNWLENFFSENFFIIIYENSNGKFGRHYIQKSNIITVNIDFMQELCTCNTIINDNFNEELNDALNGEELQEI